MRERDRKRARERDEGVDNIKQIIQGQQVQSPTMSLDKS